MKLSLVIISFNTRELLRACLQNVYQQLATVPVQAEVIVVDNASRDQSAEMVEQAFPQVQLLRSPINLGFAAANNLGFTHCRGEYLVLLNSDAFFHDGALAQALQLMEQHPQVGMGGGLLVGRDGCWQPSARQFPSLLNDFLSLSGLAARYPRSRWFGRADRTWAAVEQPAAVDWVPGAFAIVRAQIVQQLGGFDERFFLYYEEVDWCRRIQHAGWQIMYWPSIKITHIGGESSRTLDQAMSNSGSQLTLWRLRSAYLYYRKHHGWQAVAARTLEYRWHWLRALRHRHTDKAQVSQQLLQLIQQAWRDTDGGRVSPPRPWSVSGQ